MTPSVLPVPPPGRPAPAIAGGSAPHAEGSSPTATFEALLQPVLATAYRAALHMTREPAEAEDVVQDAALQAFRAFDTFELGTNFKAWFMRILTNVFLTRCRKARRSAETVSFDDVPDLYLYGKTAEAGFHESGADPAQLFFSKLDTEKVSEAIQALPFEFRTVAVLYFIEDLSYHEMAKILDCPVGTVRSRLHRGRKMLQKALWSVAQEHGLV